MKKTLAIVLFLVTIICIVFTACHFTASDKVSVNIDGVAYPKLSDYHFFKENIKELIPNERVLPYSIITSLFSDYAYKQKFVWMPEGKSAAYSRDETLLFPIGTVLINTLYYLNDFRDEKKGRKLIETQLLIKKEKKWDALTYVWNNNQTDAELVIAGDTKNVEWTDANGNKRTVSFNISNKNQCKSCHSFNNELVPIGTKVRYLNQNYNYTEGTKNQLDKWTEIGYLKGYKKEENADNKIAAWNNENDGSLEFRAKSYLEVNCAHCHRNEGNANVTGLFLLLSDHNPESWGFMKSPVSAGAGSGINQYDIVPGKPGESILVYRIESTDLEVMMPELGRSLTHAEGTVLVKEWIASIKIK
jgi:uncharacterized repeat protein (TIGR03806 family)